MKTSDFYFDLPQQQIAQFPPEKRGTCRLMYLHRDSDEIEHKNMSDFSELITPETLIVFNDTKVRKVRIFANSKQGGGRVEFFLIKAIKPNLWECLVSKAKKQKIGKAYIFPGKIEGSILEITPDNHRIVEFSQDLEDQYLNKFAHMPLPPYIKREDQELDELRYQTVFAREKGSAAAPTASLHFTENILSQLKEKAIEYCFITLHVGLGTFSPVRSDNILDHKMHSEDFSISEESALAIEKAHREGRPILAVGTTAVRALESAWDGKGLSRGRQQTDIFIYPGYQFKLVNKMFTNFHTPESTLLMLVSAFAGKGKVLNSYITAQKEGYMFFSYGDAMLIQ